MAATIADILAAKGSEVVTVTATAATREVVSLLAARGIGAVIVVNDADTPVGIAAERDIIHAVADDGAAALDQPISRVMHTELPSCTPLTQVDEVAALMTEGRHRHVPVVVDGALLGIVSVGDVVRARLDHLTDTAEQLQAYVAGSY